jgi:hypothetical protein
MRHPGARAQPAAASGARSQARARAAGPDRLRALVVRTPGVVTGRCRWIYRHGGRVPPRVVSGAQCPARSKPGGHGRPKAPAPWTPGVAGRRCRWISHRGARVRTMEAIAPLLVPNHGRRPAPSRAPPVEVTGAGLAPQAVVTAAAGVVAAVGAAVGAGVAAAAEVGVVADGVAGAASRRRVAGGATKSSG